MRNATETATVWGPKAQARRARLNAAAPELLEACELAARIFARDGIRDLRGLAYTDGEPERIAAAIAKATEPD